MTARGTNRFAEARRSASFRSITTRGRAGRGAALSDRTWLDCVPEAIRTALAAATAATVLLLGSSTGAFAQGCAMCGTAVSSPNDPLGRGMALSIVFMLAVPNIIVGSIGGWLFYVYRRAARAGRWPSGQNGRTSGGAASSEAGRPGPSSSGEPT